MSYDIDLVDPVTGEVLHVDTPHHLTGGTYCVGGTTELTLNITYNYAEILQKVLGKKGIRSIYGKTAAETYPILEKAVKQLNNDVSTNYWEATEGNVKRALLKLIAIGSLRPDGIWEGD